MTINKRSFKYTKRCRRCADKGIFKLYTTTHKYSRCCYQCKLPAGKNKKFILDY
jgi:hypothetical protein